MILEAISTLLTAVGIVFSRLDRHHDAAMAAPDLRSGLLQLDGLLEEWLVAAQATNIAAGTWLPESGDDLLNYRLTTQGDLADQVHGMVQSPLRAGSDDPVSRDAAPLRRLFEIYAPAESARVAEWAKDRYDLVNQMLEVVATTHSQKASFVGVGVYIKKCGFLELGRVRLGPFG